MQDFPSGQTSGTDLLWLNNQKATFIFQVATHAIVTLGVYDISELLAAPRSHSQKAFKYFGAVCTIRGYS